jgi:hypothetical protein
LPSQIFTFGMSRSGTTLLTTILDAHPEVSMGYELLPTGVSDAGAAARLVLAAGDDARTCSARLEAAGEHELSVLVHRADRTLVSPPELAGILQDFDSRGEGDLSLFPGRIALSRAIVAVKARKEGTSITGFKLNSPRIGLFDDHVGDGAAYVYITRDPRDIWRSHVEREFDRTLEEMATAWNTYRQRFEAFSRRHPDRCFLLRYEDLVEKPTVWIDELCTAIGLPRDPAMDRFYESKASVLRGGHANSGELRQDFFTSSIGRWQGKLSEHEVRTLESTCYEGMEERVYPRTTEVGFRFPPKEWTRHLERLAKRRHYYADEYADLVLPAVERYEHRTWLDATAAAEPRPDEVLVIRHDIDHDIENAVRMARWEAEHGIRATYCVLHTAWYYGRFDEWRLTARSEDMVERCLEIQELGHEVNLHNNTIVAALRTGADPYDLLAEELDFLRGRGLDVRGTSTHGDVLCAPLGFSNLELFSETVYPSRGGARTIEHEGNKVTIGTRSMSEFGLAYEGYDLPRDVYVTDSGGNLRLVTDTPGRAGLERPEFDPPVPYRKVVGILTHPVWWDLEQKAPPGRPEVGLDALLAKPGASTPRRRFWRRRR